MNEGMTVGLAGTEIGHFLLDLEIAADRAIIFHLHPAVAVIVVDRLQELRRMRVIRKFYRSTPVWWASSSDDKGRTLGVSKPIQEPEYSSSLDQIQVGPHELARLLAQLAEGQMRR